MTNRHARRKDAAKLRGLRKDVEALKGFVADYDRIIANDIAATDRQIEGREEPFITLARQLSDKRLAPVRVERQRCLETIAAFEARTAPPPIPMNADMLTNVDTASPAHAGSADEA